MAIYSGSSQAPRRQGSSPWLAVLVSLRSFKKWSYHLPFLQGIQPLLKGLWNSLPIKLSKPHVLLHHERKRNLAVSLPPRAHELVLVCIHGVLLPVDCLMVVVPPSKRRTYILLMWHLILWSVVLLSFTGYFTTCCLPCFSHWRSIKPSNLRWLDKQGYSAEVDSLNVEITVRDGGENYCTVLWLAFISFWNRNKMAWQSFNFKWKTHIRKTMIKMVPTIIQNLSRAKAWLKFISNLSLLKVS